MSTVLSSKPYFVVLLHDTYQLIKIHGLDGRYKEPQYPRRLFLLEAFKLGLDVDENFPTWRLNNSQKDALIAAWDALETRMPVFHPGYLTLSLWLQTDADTEKILALMENVLADYEVRP